MAAQVIQFSEARRRIEARKKRSAAPKPENIQDIEPISISRRLRGVHGRLRPPATSVLAFSCLTFLAAATLTLFCAVMGYVPAWTVNQYAELPFAVLRSAIVGLVITPLAVIGHALWFSRRSPRTMLAIVGLVEGIRTFNRQLAKLQNADCEDTTDPNAPSPLEMRHRRDALQAEHDRLVAWHVEQGYAN